MAMLGLGDYLCEACAHFDTDGIDGNSPFCGRQSGAFGYRAVRLGERCPHGYEPGVPSGYPVHMERNERRAREIAARLGIGEVE